MSTTEKRQKVVKSHPGLSLERQCELLEIHRSGLYYKPKGESALNLELMKKIDLQLFDHPHYGVERMTDYLKLDLGYHINKKRVRRLYKLMGIQTIYPKPKTTIRDKTSYIYPYLLRGLEIDHPNHVWQTDITYIPMFRGFMYMAAIIDVYSRKILNWSISNSMSKEWCVELLNDTVKQFGAPEIHNSDQGSQYTSDLYIDTLKNHKIKISMDGRGRALDNIYIERFWRTLKQEKIYLNPANGGLELYQNVREYIEFYNKKRRHTSIGKIPPDELFYQKAMAS
ncbi:MAG: IS3 family transposase [Crocinitomix sp.]|nr:IS3 family transposase [Crocinitomix sp.]